MDEEYKTRLVFTFHSLKADLATITDVLAECSEFWQSQLHYAYGTSVKEGAPDIFLGAGVSLVNALDSFIGRFETDHENRGLNAEMWTGLLAARADLRVALECVPSLDLAFELRHHARAVLDSVARFSGIGVALHRETVRQLRMSALRVYGLSCFNDLERARVRLADSRRRIIESIETDKGVTVNPVSIGTEFDAVIGELVMKMAALGEPERIVMRPDLRCPGIRVLASRDDLELAIGDLFLNALKYSDRLRFPEDSWVDVKTTRRGERVELRIENWGKAISDVELSSGLIFEYGYRGESIRESPIPGSGVGLYRSREMVSRLGGSLELFCRQVAENRSVTTAVVQFPRVTTPVMCP